VAPGEGFLGRESALPDSSLPPPSPASLADFQSRRFGMFVHWGPVSLTGHELGWARGSEVPAAEYDRLYLRYDPAGFDAGTWVRIAREAGMRYMVVTAKHMDGFCLWDTRQTDYNIMHTPFRRDVMAELADACRRGGIAFGAYYCIADWYNPWFPFSGPYYGPKDTVLKPTTDLERYDHYVMKQLAELLSDYGPMECVWFDSMAGADSAARGRRLVTLCRALQPGVLVNNRAGVPGDYVTPEERIGRYRDDRPWESCMMIGTQWSWKPNDRLKSFRQLLRALVYCAGGDGNLLLDVGPNAQGVIEPATVARLRQIGDWLARNGESIYGTRGGPYKPTSWLASTRQGDTVYLHVTRWDGARVVLPPLPRRVLRADLLAGGDVRVTQDSSALVVEVPERDRRPVDTVVRLRLDGPALGIAPIALPPEVAVTASATRGPAGHNEAAFAMDSDPDTEWSAPDGQTSGTLEFTFTHPRRINSIHVEEKARPTLIQAWEVSSWDGARWVPLATRTTHANWRADIGPVTVTRLRLRILKSNGTAAVSELVLGDADD
jgi:alpha-L-fucosidase